MRTSTPQTPRAAHAAACLIGALLISAGVPGRAAARVAQDPGTPASLAGVLRRALDVHPSIQAAAAASDAARAGLQVARAAWLPQFGVEGGVTRFQEPMLVAPLHRFDPTAVPDFDPTLMRGTLGASWTVFDGGRRSADVDRARALDGAGRAERRDVEAELLASTADAYLAILSGRE
ncbi:MAG: TolC family protein, partial [Gemmatimonadetes bacterium]|nr:TolC family protein [Gemmatimonadota bacterium]